MNSVKLLHFCSSIVSKLQSWNDEIVSVSALLCGLSAIICAEHLVESLAFSWFPGPHPHLSKWHLCPFLALRPHLLVLFLIFASTPHLVCLLIPISHHLCCCPRSNHHHLLPGLLREPSAGLCVSVVSSLESLVSLADRMCQYTSKLVYVTRLPPHIAFRPEASC